MQQEAYGEGLSVFGLICDVLGLRPLYKPHRNGDAIRVAKLLGQMRKEKLCVRPTGPGGRRAGGHCLAHRTLLLLPSPLVALTR